MGFVLGLYSLLIFKYLLKHKKKNPSITKKCAIMFIFLKRSPTRYADLADSSDNGQHLEK